MTDDNLCSTQGRPPSRLAAPPCTHILVVPLGTHPRKQSSENFVYYYVLTLHDFHDFFILYSETDPRRLQNNPVLFLSNPMPSAPCPNAICARPSGGATAFAC
jgi:hypothetical protein